MNVARSPTERAVSSGTPGQRARSSDSASCRHTVTTSSPPASYPVDRSASCEVVTACGSHRFEVSSEPSKHQAARVYCASAASIADRAPAHFALLL